MEGHTRLLMFDSGAFSVWTQGITIEVDDYINFCEKWPDATYYVNLDVMPGKPGVRPTTAGVEESCRQGWLNYKRMTERLPKHKVIPVFHNGDPIHWLRRYLDDGVTYLGISPGKDRRVKGRSHKATFAGREHSETKIQWLRSIRRFVFDGDKPLVKMHGFAVTSFKLLDLDFWYWHSVDSTSWRMVASFGGVYVPMRGADGEWDFRQQPRIVTVSPVKNNRLHHNISATSVARADLMQWLEELEIPLGSFEVKDVPVDYKLDRTAKEVWFKRVKRVRKKRTLSQRGTLVPECQSQVLVPIETGIYTTAEERSWVNVLFMKRANEALKDRVKNIYFAGDWRIDPELEFFLGKRLLSYNDLNTPPADRLLVKHCKYIRQHKEKRHATQTS